MRRNTDEEIRRLERLAAQGDRLAQARLEAMKARTGREVFLDWDDLVEELDLTKQLIYHDKKTQMTESPDWILDQADQDAHYWIQEYQADRRSEAGGPQRASSLSGQQAEDEGDEDFELSEEQRQAVRDTFFFAVKKEWLPKTRLEGEIDEIVDPINEWAERGMQSAEITDRDLPAGHAVDYRIVEGEFMEGSGISFILYQPFLTALVEAGYCVHGGEDEGQELDSITAKDVIQVYKWIRRCEGEKLIDISGDVSDYTPPREHELLAAIRILDDLKWMSWPATERKVTVKVARQRGWIRHDEPDSEIGASLADSLASIFESDLQPSLTKREKEIGKKIARRIRGPQKNPPFAGFSDRVRSMYLRGMSVQQIVDEINRAGGYRTGGWTGGPKRRGRMTPVIRHDVSLSQVLYALRKADIHPPESRLKNPKAPPAECEPGDRPLDTESLIGQRVRVHLNLHNGCYAISQRGKTLGYASRFALASAASSVSRSGYKRCREEKKRNVHAWLEGVLLDEPSRTPIGWRRVSYNCLTHPPCFFYVDDGACFVKAIEVRGFEGGKVWVKA